MKYKIWISNNGDTIELQEDLEGKYCSQDTVKEVVQYTARQIYIRRDNAQKKPR